MEREPTVHVSGAGGSQHPPGHRHHVPPLYGVKSLSFYSDPRPSTVRHLELARRAFNRMHPASYVALDVNDLDTLRDALGEQHEAVSGLARVRLF